MRAFYIATAFYTPLFMRIIELKLSVLYTYVEDIDFKLKLSVDRGTFEM